MRSHPSPRAGSSRAARGGPSEGRRYLRRSAAVPGAAVFVAETPEGIVGRLSLAHDARGLAPCRGLGLMVAAGHRRLGVGTALLEQAAEGGGGRSLKLELHVFPHNAPAIALYERFGFARGLPAGALPARRRDVRRRDPYGVRGRLARLFSRPSLKSARTRDDPPRNVSANCEKNLVDHLAAEGLATSWNAPAPSTGRRGVEADRAAVLGRGTSVGFVDSATGSAKLWSKTGRLCKRDVSVESPAQFANKFAGAGLAAAVDTS